METTKKKLQIFATDKIAFIKARRPDLTITFERQGDQTAYCIEDTQEVRQLLSEFQGDSLIPAKTFSDLIKAMRSQLMAAKKSFTKAEG